MRKQGSFWRSIPGILTGIAAVLTAVAGIIVAIRPQSGGEVFLEPTANFGPDPFTDSVAAPTPNSTIPPSTSPTPAGPGKGESSVVVSESGAKPALYGGTQQVDRCDSGQLTQFLVNDSAKGSAWAEAQGINVNDIPAFVTSLTPVILQSDTRVTNHGFRNGRPTPRQSVLQAGTAVLVDTFGAPRVRCACGNPLRAPRPVQRAPRFVGDRWSGFSPANLTAVKPSDTTLESLTLVDIVTGARFQRPTGSPRVLGATTSITTATVPRPTTTATKPTTTVTGLTTTTTKATTTTTEPTTTTTEEQVDVDGTLIGTSAFADEVVDAKIGPDVATGRRNPRNALGPPDCDDSDTCPNEKDVSLGTATQKCQFFITLRFVDNVIFNGPGDDLRVIEIGKAEPTDIFVVHQGRFIEVGKIQGGDKTIDLSPAVPANAEITEVKLCDAVDIDESASPGADIDAVAGLNSRSR